MKRLFAYLFLALVLLSCGTMNKSSQTASSPILTREVGEVDAPATPSQKKETPVTTPPAKEEKPAPKPLEERLSDQVVAYAKTFLGTPYKLGASGPTMFDCSGFTCYVFKHFGYTLTQYTGIQFREGREVESYGDLQKGDLVFFGKRGSVRVIGHVGIVVSVNEERGSFSFIHASTSGGVVISESTQPYYLMRYIGARRILPDE